MNKRDLLLSLLDRNKKAEYIPAAFFLHFDQVYHRGQAAVDKHLEYSRYTGMDFVKIQFEHTFLSNRRGQMTGSVCHCTRRIFTRMTWRLLMVW